jgi:rhodanese-related sulfurtransferase
VIWAEIETVGWVAKFHTSGAKGHLYLYELLHVPPAALAAALVLVALGAFLFGERVERMVNGAAPAPAAAPRRWVFRGLGAVGVAALLTLLVPVGTSATPAAAARISAADLARRVLEEPWKVRVLDVRGMDACAAARVPGAECAPVDTLKNLYLGDVSPARDLVVVAAGDVGELPAEVRAYRGKVLALEGGFAAWSAYALAAPPPPAPGAGPQELEAYRLRAGLQAALTGVKAPPPPPPSAGGAPVKRKAGGGGCSG